MKLMINHSTFTDDGNSVIDMYVVNVAKVTRPEVRELLEKGIASIKSTDYYGPIPLRTSAVVIDFNYIMSDYVEKYIQESEELLPCEVEGILSIQEPFYTLDHDVN